MADGNSTARILKCIGEGCQKDAFARGMCKTHYSRWRIHGNCETVLTRRLPKKCEVDGCGNNAHVRWKKGKAVCNSHWQCLYRYGTESPPPTAPHDPMPICSVHKCNAESRSRNAGLCEKHYGRMRRNGNLDARDPLHCYVTQAGYVILRRPNHPLADSDGRVAEHRVVAFDAYAGICPNCFWCDTNLSWDDAVVDHLDENKQNNVPRNLVVSCNRCNRSRGAMLPFVAAMRPEAVSVFIERIMAYRSDRAAR